MKHTNIYIILFAFLILGGLFFLRDWYYFYDMKKLYHTEKYDELTEKYHSNTNAYALHNLGNARYKTGSGELEKLEEALSYYSGALSLGENRKTRHNYEFIKNIIEEIQQQQQEEKEEEQSEDEKNEEKDKIKDENTPSQANSDEEKESNGQESQKQEGAQNGEESEKDDTKGQKSGSSQRGEEYKIDTQDAIGEISQEEKEALEQEIENLKREQIHNQKFYGKQPEKAEFRSLFDDFFGDSINRGGEKDW